KEPPPPSRGRVGAGAPALPLDSFLAGENNPTLLQLGEGVPLRGCSCANRLAKNPPPPILGRVGAGAAAQEFIPPRPGVPLPTPPPFRGRGVQRVPVGWMILPFVIAGLDPAIQVPMSGIRRCTWIAGTSPGDDERESALSEERVVSA